MNELEDETLNDNLDEDDDIDVEDDLDDEDEDDEDLFEGDLI